MNVQKISQFVLKLIKLTNNNEIEWGSMSFTDPETDNGDIILDKIYITNIHEKKFQMYRCKYKYWLDIDQFEWSQRVRLELLDSSGNVEYEFEYDNSMDDLYGIVREKTSGISEIIDQVLGKDLDIITATYGTNKEFYDVAEQIRSKISFNKLSILASNEIAGDPHHGQVKLLKVRYKFAGETKEKEVREGETLELP